MSVTILNHDLLMSENFEHMDTAHSHEKYSKIKKKSKSLDLDRKEMNWKKGHQLHKHMFATVPIYCIHRGIIFPIIREG